MTKFYIDTNVVINAIKGEFNPFGKSIGDPASDLFFSIKNNKHNAIISTWMVEELDKTGNLDNANFFFLYLEDRIIHVDYDDEDKQKARELKPDNYPDALHVVLAEKSNSDCIVTRDTDHFNQIPTNIPVKKPEELL
jgi:predicted nucleic acid-binding protein